MAEHKMPEGIAREAPGVYVTHDGKIEIRRNGDGKWRIADRADSERFTLEPFKNRAGAVAWLDEQKLLVAKPAQPKPVEDMTAKELTEVKPELHPDAKPNGTKPVEPVTEQELLDRILNS